MLRKTSQDERRIQAVRIETYVPTGPVRFATPVLVFCAILAGCTGREIRETRPEPLPREEGHESAELVDDVNPLVGTDSSYEFSHGNTYPAVSYPFGMIQWTPQTNEKSWLYQYSAKAIQGIRGTHSPSVWMGDYGSFVVMPVVGELEPAAEKRASRFEHAREDSRPHCYKVFLEDYDTTAEVTPTERGGFLRFDFPDSDEAAVLIEIQPGPGHVEVIPEEQKIVGYSACGQRGDPPNFKSHFVAHFDVPFRTSGTWSGEKIQVGSREAVGEAVGAFAKLSTRRGEPVLVRIGTSFVSRQQAETNLARELPDWDFERSRSKARETWNELLGRIEVEGGSREQRRAFYTAFYRAVLFPRMLYEVRTDGKLVHYSPFDGAVHEGVMYTDTGFWDTYRAQFPFLTMLFPDRVDEIVRGLLAAFDEGGWLPKWPSPGYRNVMIGTHADAVIVDAYVKGLRGFDVEKALRAMKRNAFEPGTGAFAGREGIEAYIEKGYVPADRVREATARTLEFAYGDFCVGRMAEALGHRDVAARLYERARTYEKVFDSETGFMRGRNADGAWVEPFSAIEWGGPYTESCAWHYLWSVQQDIPGLIELLGGREAFANKLDLVFETPPRFEVGSYGQVIHEMRELQAAKMGQYAHGNEPMHHVVYLYNYVGQPWKAQKLVRDVMTKIYGDGPDGLLGDEDTGQMSSWYLFSALGFYPVTPGQPIYVVGSPLFDEVRVHLPGREKKTFAVRAVGNGPTNVYIRSATLDGEELVRPWFDHETLMAGGELVLRMGPTPNKAWGSARDAAPPGALPPTGAVIRELVER